MGTTITPRFVELEDDETVEFNGGEVNDGCWEGVGMSGGFSTMGPNGFGPLGPHRFARFGSNGFALLGPNGFAPLGSDGKAGAVGTHTPIVEAVVRLVTAVVVKIVGNVEEVVDANTVVVDGAAGLGLEGAGPTSDGTPGMFNGGSGIGFKDHGAPAPPGPVAVVFAVGQGTAIQGAE
ncbi:hypothetical protein BDK51DRAFT_45081 [Blyttiomyces helicus]|uniref:Uncharacterized protein n=1 Tax=Blyttiomyces helicus TaxID=388810 RepID=A0A4P9VTH9_9FUNG|nr:hypothetical protein BDK51DRAFT_45081 [Blyttiomyces helicus]|eukprot:RKO82829.1 hypothetical protein BDK51DRAFT_45081 [Blyttiomyces helicus]